MIKTSNTLQDIQVTDFLLRLINFDLGDILEYIRNNFTCDEVYPVIDLQTWAEENGYTK